MKMEMRVFDQVYNELKLLQQEDAEDIVIAHQSLMAAMVFTMHNAPSLVQGLCLISDAFNDIMHEYTLKNTQMEGE
jgi:hypothetical protein|tara:strand:- start:287 stop:514 length:228 start_codon:yes stop_codon:yes gene_type:complete